MEKGLFNTRFTYVYANLTQARKLKFFAKKIVHNQFKIEWLNDFFLEKLLNIILGSGF